MSQDTHHFLVEIGTEELPPTSLKALSKAFTDGIKKGLAQRKLQFSRCDAFATPRRLAVQIAGLDAYTPTESLKVWGPPAKVAFDKDGQPGKAAIAFAKKNGISVEQLNTANDGKQDKLLHERSTGGEASRELLGDIVRTSLAELPIKKRMRWGSKRDEFVRPVHWLVMLLDDQIIDEQVFGIKAGNLSRGHRFHSNQNITIPNAQSYAELLQSEGHVMVSREAREAAIKEQVTQAAEKLGGQAVIDQSLLEEVTALVEWPVALAGKFDEDFLSVPTEALISSMKEHQKYFHVVDSDGKLLPCFITVSNIISKDPQQVIEGNERVIRPRLADAAFFFKTDKSTSLEARREKLKTVVFQAKLGSVFDKTERIKLLAGGIASKLNTDVSSVERAAMLCKSDLVSAMVNEFSDMQGIAGFHYALNDGETEAVALAIKEQYLPKFSGDQLPSSDSGAIIALADRLDTITGIFGIGQKPTGSKDPFGLRRASLGALRILVEKQYDLDLRELIELAASTYKDLPKADSVCDDVLSYMLDRFKAWYEEENIAAEIFQAVNAKQLSCPLDINQRVHAVQAFSQLPEAQALAAANKRVSNILAKQESKPGFDVNEKLLTEPQEQALSQQLQQFTAKVGPLMAQREYTQALCQLADLRETIDNFFDKVMVMAEDPALRNNRLALLNQLRALFLEVADISCLAVKA
ncbi:MAG: glycine--tRNA ligase subunit beta [Alteromonadaceae bacterium]|nr:MAG: glycine--tRNA ligase subunit beta [Alteromonadaceae bacterium]